MGTLDEGKRWQTVLAENPGAIDGRYNRNRRALLEPGVYLDLSLETAKSWFHDIVILMMQYELLLWSY